MLDDTFVMKKKYKIVDAIDPTKSWGKFPQALGNVFFVDSHYLLTDLLDMFHNKVQKMYDNHNHESEYIEATDELFELLYKRVQFYPINDYAIQVCGKMSNRNENFVFGHQLASE